MSANRNGKTVKFSVTIPAGVHENLCKTARDKHTTVADIVRSFISKGLTVEWAESSENLIRRIIHDEVDTVFEHHIERLIKLIAKSTKSSASALYLLLILIQNDYADEAGTEDILAVAFKQAAAYMKFKEKSMEEYAAEAREFILSGKNIGKKDDN